MHILWVEDHPDTIEVFAKLMRERGYRVSPAKTLAEARVLAERDDFDVLVADIALPDGSGLSLPQIVRQHHPSLPCIAVSAEGQVEAIARALDAGFDHYLIKPVVVDDLFYLLAGIDVPH